MSHPIIIWPDSPLLPPAPLADGLSYDEPDANGSVHSYANAEFIAECNWVMQRQSAVRKTLKATIAEFSGERDSVPDIGDYFDLNDSQAKAINLSCNPVRFANVHGLPLPALDSNNNAAGVNAYAWEAKLANLLASYRNAAQVNVNRGYTGQQGAVA